MRDYALRMASIIAANVKTLRLRLGDNQEQFAARIGVQQSYISKWEHARVVPEGDSIAAMAELADCSFDDFKKKMLTIKGKAKDGQKTKAGPAIETDGDDIPMVDIQHIDMAYGLGTTFAVDYPDIEVMKFPKVWIESITHSPPATLTWTRGKGDSMEPTIRDGDLVLLDRSQRALTERDAMWAFTIGEEAAIKRLRKQGEMCEIFSDNPNVPPDKQPLRDLNIVGRVVFVGSRK